MSAISRGKKSRNDIEQSVGRQVSGYLARLEEGYALIVKRIPFRAKPTAKSARKGENEIDLLAENELTDVRRAFIGRHVTT